MFGTILTTILGIGSTWLNGKLEESKVKAQSKAKIAEAEAEAKAMVIKSRAQADADYDKAAMDASAHSWKDEYWTIVLSIPAILAFIPSTRPFIFDGFNALNSMPPWYQFCVTGAIVASFGLRSWKGIVKK